jgi:hypothetical protein
MVFKLAFENAASPTMMINQIPRQRLTKNVVKKANALPEERFNFLSVNVNSLSPTGASVIAKLNRGNFVNCEPK